MALKYFEDLSREKQQQEKGLEEAETGLEQVDVRLEARDAPSCPPRYLPPRPADQLAPLSDPGHVLFSALSAWAPTLRNTTQSLARGPPPDLYRSDPHSRQRLLARPSHAMLPPQLSPSTNPAPPPESEFDHGFGGYRTQNTLATRPSPSPPLPQSPHPPRLNPPSPPERECERTHSFHGANSSDARLTLVVRGLDRKTRA
ncbi:hypothetical protein B0H13DRAFT_2672174 [Mycena leptocephala]|nr:hypothetical protein B0H13DRAFT_2672174 [Mycena leptocephala]